MNAPRYVDASQRGLTLVELLVSLLLGLLLSGGIVTLYLESKRAYQADEALARIQEHGRFALNLLRQELAMAGFFGGARGLQSIDTPTVSGDCASGNWALAVDPPLDVVDDPGPGTLTLNSGTELRCIDAATIQAGSDLLLIKRTASQPSIGTAGPVPGFTAADTPRWYLRTGPDSEAQAWERQAPADLTAGSVAVGEGASYWERYTRVYYLRRFSDPAAQSVSVPTLCRESLVGDAMASRCLVEGVEDMQFEFGIDTDYDGVPNRYGPAVSADDLRRAVTARVFLLLRSIDELPGTGLRRARIYRLGSKLVSRSDDYLRQVFSTTVQLKNASPAGRRHAL